MKKTCASILLSAGVVLSSAVAAWASAESEQEPAAGEPQVLLKAITALQSSKMDQLRSFYDDKEKTAYYLRDASFLGRVKTPAGYRLAFGFTFIRSSPYREGTITPPRAHTYAVVFDDSFKILFSQAADMPGDIQLKGSILSAKDRWKVDLKDLSSFHEGN